jgi:hypothetical protein
MERWETPTRAEHWIGCSNRRRGFSLPHSIWYDIISADHQRNLSSSVITKNGPGFSTLTARLGRSPSSHSYSSDHHEAVKRGKMLDDP